MPHPKDLHRVSLNLNIRGLKTSATLAINERCAALAAEGREVFRLGFGQSPFPVPPPVVEALQRHAAEKDYLPVKGLYALRAAVATYYQQRQKLACSAEDVLIGPGSKELLFLLQLVYYGELLIPQPSWVSYSPQARIIGRNVHWLSTLPQHQWRLMPEQLEALCAEDPERPRIVILNYPANPTGATYSTERLKALARIARKYRVILLSDEIYGELHHKGQHVSIARFYPEGTIISSGLSKWCGAGGWRLGTFLFPPSLRWLQDAMAVTASETYTATSAPIQHAAVRAFQLDESLETYLHHSRRVLRALGQAVSRRLGEAHISHPLPEGGFYLFPNFALHRESLARRGIHDSATLCRQLLDDTGVALLPGQDFGAPPHELTARLSYVDFDGAAALTAAYDTPTGSLNGQFLQTYCPQVLTAAERICAWL